MLHQSMAYALAEEQENNIQHEFNARTVSVVEHNLGLLCNTYQAL
jgi:hypothetical protein